MTPIKREKDAIRKEYSLKRDSIDKNEKDLIEQTTNGRPYEG